MVDEVDHLLESLRVCVIEEEPLVFRVAKSGAEVWAGDGKKEPVTTKLLPGDTSESICMTFDVAQGPSHLSASKTIE